MNEFSNKKPQKIYTILSRVFNFCMSKIFLVGEWRGGGVGINEIPIPKFRNCQHQKQNSLFKGLLMYSYHL